MPVFSKRHWKFGNFNLIIWKILSMPGNQTFVVAYFAAKLFLVRSEIT